MKKDPSSKNTTKFYNELVEGKKNFTFFSNETRFNIDNILNKKNLTKYFDNKIEQYLSDDLDILDYGCGPGTFLIKLSRMTKSKLFGADISGKFIEQSKFNFDKFNLTNIDTIKVEPEKLPYSDKKFDIIFLIDVIHHLDNIEKNLDEIKRVLKKNGKIIIYEPNKLNPIIWMMHLIDKNERGLFRVGSFNRYREIFKNHEFKIEKEDYNGIVIGPTSKILDLLSDILNNKYIYPILGFLNPKIFMVVGKN
tara:strand:+ start:174 stop:926 length:753 start_codon:yes stop_codon:yes gene_type:complete